MMESKKGSEKERVNERYWFLLFYLKYSSERFVPGIQVKSVDRRNDSGEETSRDEFWRMAIRWEDTG